MRQAAILFVCFSVLSVLAAAPACAVKINSPAPDFSLNDLRGNKVSLSSHRGKVVILNFWSTTCGPCVAEIPSLILLQREFRSQGLVVMGISLDQTEKPVKELAEQLGIEYINLMDSNQDVYFDSYGLFGQPVSIIVDRSGIVGEKIIGGVNWTAPQMQRKIQSYLKGR